MDIRIEVNEEGNGCKVWLGTNAVSFPAVEAAKAYVAQLEARIGDGLSALTLAPEPQAHTA